MTEYDKVIPPGGVGKITASINTTNFKGPVNKGITVTTSDPARPSFQIQLKADVYTPIDVQPEYLNFNGPRGDMKPAEVRIRSVEGKPFHITNVSSDGNVKVDLRPDTPPVAPSAPAEPEKPADLRTEKKKEREKSRSREKETPKVEDAQTQGVPSNQATSYIVTVTPDPALPVGQARGQIVFSTDHSKSSQLQVNYFIMVRGEVEVLPTTVYFPPVAPGVTGATGATAEPAAQHVKVRKPTGTELKILGVDVPDPDLKATVTPLVEGREYDVEIRYTGKPGRGILRSQITVRTNDPNQASLVVPVTGRM